LKEIKLSISIAIGVFIGLISWSYLTQYLMPSIQQCGTSKKPCVVSIDDSVLNIQGEVELVRGTQVEVTNTVTIQGDVSVESPPLHPLAVKIEN
jgi:hypothetical protein